MTHRPPTAFLALWNSISDLALQQEYDTWHTLEHVPERVGLPGFIEARRYRSVNGSVGSPENGASQPPRYFTCYWLDSLAALATPQYREVFTHPTPWSARMRTTLREFFRLPCGLSGRCGQSTASQLVTVHLRSDDAVITPLLADLLTQGVAQGRWVCAQWGTAAKGDDFPIANVVASAQFSGQSSGDSSSDIVLMLQGLDSAALFAHTRMLLQALAPAVTPVSEPQAWVLQSGVRQDELTHPLDVRQPPCDALFHAFPPIQAGDTR